VVEAVRSWKRALAVSAIVAFLLPGLTSASVYQQGYGADVRGIAPSAGPDRNETAFELDLPGQAVPTSAPIIRDGKVYVITAANITGDDRGDRTAYSNNTVKGLFEIDLATATYRRVVELNVNPTSMAADEKFFYITTERGLEAYRVGTWQPAWPKPWVPPSANVKTHWDHCEPPVLRGEWLYLACWAELSPGNGCGEGFFASKIRTSDAKHQWTWWNKTFDSAGLPPNDNDCGAPRYNRISVIGDHVFVAAWSFWSRENSQWVNAVFQLRDSDGGMVRMYASKPAHRVTGMAEVSDQKVDSTEHALWWEYPPPTGTPDLVFMRIGELVWARPATGEIVFRRDFEQPETGNVDGNWGREDGAGMAFDGRRLYFTSGRELRAIDVQDPPASSPMAWSESAPFLRQYEYWEEDPLVLSRGTLYAHSNLHLHEEGYQIQTFVLANAKNWHRFWAIDAATGLEKWHREMPVSALKGQDPITDTVAAAAQPLGRDGRYGVTWTAEWRFAIGEGVLAAAQVTGHVVVVGRTGASIQPILADVNLYPALGEEVTVDLSGSKPGASGAATEYKADWADGTVTEWQSSPIFRHAYELSGDHKATFELRNAAGQNSIEPVDFCVACQDPGLEQRLAALRDDSEPSVALEQPEPRKGGIFGLDEWPVGASLLGLVLLLLAGLIPAVTRRRPSLAAPRFRIESELGYGAASKVLLAHDTVLDRKVVLKQPLSPWLLERKGREQFLREAQILARLNHPNVVAIHEVLPHEEPPMLVLEYVPRGSLNDLLRNAGPLPPTTAINLIDDVLAALEHVHDHGIIHRDIKPANVLIDGHDRGKLTDFNIAQPPADLASTAAYTRQGNRSGSPSYMSPEQSRGERLDVRSDLYSAAAVLYEALTGTHYLGPTATSDVALVEGIQHQDPVLPHRSIPPRIAVFLQRALAKEPSARFANAGAMRKALADAARKIKPTLGSR
jgi:tRNA A-37 threonylcarbamoyl transferase component Bud32